MKKSVFKNAVQLTDAAEDVAEQKAVQHTRDKAQQNGEKRVDAKKRGPEHAHTADANRLQKACEAEDGSCDETTYRSEGQCGHGDRDNVERDGERPDVQIAERRKGHQQQKRRHQAEQSELLCVKFLVHIQFSFLVIILRRRYNTIRKKYSTDFEKSQCFLLTLTRRKVINWA